jgi:hypothetical protein
MAPNQLVTPMANLIQEKEERHGMYEHKHNCGSAVFHIIIISYFVQRPNLLFHPADATSSNPLNNG